MDNKIIILYLIIVTVGLFLLYWPVRFWLEKTQTRRIKSLQKRKSFEAVTTDSPVGNPHKRACSIGQESIETRFNFFRKSILPILLFIWILLIAIPLLSFASATYISLILGTITVIVGIAAKPLIENLIAGFVISISQPVRIGDTVLFEDQYGTIEDIALTYTVIKLWDWRRYIVPNNRFIQSDLINYSLIDKFLWAKVEFCVSLEADLAKVEQLATSTMQQSKYCSQHEPPSFWVMNMEKDSVVCWVAGWADTPSDAWELKHQTRRALQRELIKEKIKGHINYYTRMEEKPALS